MQHLQGMHLICTNPNCLAAGNAFYTAVTRHFLVALDSSASLVLTFQAAQGAASPATVAAIEVRSCSVQRPYHFILHGGISHA